MRENEACAVPLIELLRRIPKDYRAQWEQEPYHHCSSPVGLHCHEAADALEAAKAENKRLREALLTAAKRVDSDAFYLRGHGSDVERRLRGTATSILAALKETDDAQG